LSGIPDILTGTLDYIKEEKAFLRETVEKITKGATAYERTLAKLEDVFTDAGHEALIEFEDTVREAIGYGQFLVMDTARMKIKASRHDGKGKDDGQSPTPVNVTVHSGSEQAPAPPPQGIRAALGQVIVKKFGSDKAATVAQAPASQAPLVSIEDLAKQLSPFMNLLTNWYYDSERYVHYYRNEDTIQGLTAEYKKGAVKLLNTIVSLTVAATVYRETDMVATVASLGEAQAKTLKEMYHTEITKPTSSTGPFGLPEASGRRGRRKEA